ncbi:NmrA family NAD(P)-binding protein [Streptomyces griseocarneus]|uniref:NmrA family NAD(P)-binding protein n=1 Tax=Streptomyces griseocarneus TaxID=51201 RepID=UPI00167F0616|nr:NAD(P)H-binding protein [Streptomyces griseocarneus]MBZ6477157.1 NAD(P)H-binding protein [Streptomyces griseocarneus]GHG53849.1 nucleotide-diphosphate-sugar epimerase [Streptomyces griseocarneus]
MTIVVTTPTGHVGSRVVRLLVQAGVRPRVLVRDPARLDEATRARVDVRRGDLTDAGFVREAAAGARTVFWVDPTPHAAADPIEASLRTAAPLVEAARVGDVGRVVLLSSIGAEKRHGVGHIDALAGIEEQLDATGADVLHLRCAYFFTNLLLDLEGLSRGVLTTAFDPDRPMPWVDPRDIGDVVAARLLNDTWQGRVVQAVHGPEDLTFRQVARILTQALGRTIRIDPVGDDEVRDALRAAGMPPSAVEGIVGMTAGSRDLVPEQPRDLLTTTPTPLSGWAHARLRPLLER